jgi:membrane dipeptidase
MIRRVVLAVALLALVGVLCAPNAEGQEPVSELERARELMRQVPFIDGHNDLPWALRTDYGMDWDSLDISQPQRRGPCRR